MDGVLMDKTTTRNGILIRSTEQSYTFRQMLFETSGAGQ
jgi:hypothetical protein